VTAGPVTQETLTAKALGVMSTGDATDKINNTDNPDNSDVSVTTDTLVIASDS
jgi:hypothetical protein